MNRGLLGTVAGAVVAVVLLLSSYYIVHPSERALILQFGSPIRAVDDPGLYFKLPFVQNVVYFDKRVLNFDAPSQEVPTLDQNQVIVDAFARFQIVDPLLFFQTVNNEDGIQVRLTSIISSNLRRAIGDVPMSTILSAHRADLMQQITRQVSAATASFGIKVIDVRMKRVDLPAANSEAIYRQMQTQREQVARKTRAEGQAKAVTLKADADKQQVIIVADARRQADILHGEGDAAATGIYAAAFGRDPAFFDFYRSLQAMGTALTEGGTTYVGPPDGDFFRYFRSESGLPGAAGPTKAGQAGAASSASP